MLEVTIMLTAMRGACIIVEALVAEQQQQQQQQSRCLRGPMWNVALTRRSHEPAAGDMGAVITVPVLRQPVRIATIAPDAEPDTP